MQRTRLETFSQSRVVVVVVFVGAYCPVMGNRARQLRGSTPRDDVGPMNPVVVYSGPLSCCSRHGGQRRSRCLGGALTPLGVDAPPDKGVDALPDKGVDAFPDKGVDAPPDKGVGAPPDKGADTPPNEGVGTPFDKGSRTSSGKDSAGAIRMARLLLALSSDVTATDD